MKNFLRPGFFLISGIILLLGGFGCKGLSKQEQAAVRPVNLEIWTIFDDVEVMKELMTEYRAERPYLTFTLRQLRPEEVYPRLIEALADERPPDIMSLSSRWIGQFQGRLDPMPAAVKNTVVRVTKTTVGTNTEVITNQTALPTLDQLDREYVQTVKKDVVRGGKIYGLPLSLDTMAVYYNKDLLDRAGIAEPPKNWDEFQEAVKKITRSDRNSGRILQSGAAFGTGPNVPGVDDLIYILFRQSGVDMIDNGGRAVFNVTSYNADRDTVTPSMATINFYTDFGNPARDTYAWNKQMGNALDAFVAGKAGFFFGYSYHLPQIRARAPQLNFRVLPLFQLDQEQPVNVANYFVQTVTAKSKHKDEAWGLINYLAHSAATNKYLEKTGRPTALRGLIKAQKEKADLAPFADSLLVAENWYRGSNYAAAAKAVQDMLDEWLEPPPGPEYVNVRRQEILNRAAAKINQTL